MRLPAAPVLLALAALLMFAAVLALGSGAVSLSPAQVLDALFGSSDATSTDAAVIWQVRMPRLLLAVVIGSSAAIAGCAMQGLLRNPLADPSLIGVAGGAAFAATGWLALRQSLGWDAYLPTAIALPVVAALGGLAAAITVIALGRVQQQTSVASMLLAGIAINALAGAGVGMFQQLASDAALRDISFWLFGSLARVGWAELQVAAPILAICCLGLWRQARALDSLLLGEAEARYLGTAVESCKRWVLFWVVLATGTAVAVGGLIGFIGLLVPHLLRLLVGPRHGLLMPAAALLGAALLCLADTAARSAFAPLELPVGVLTACLGAPCFLWLLRRSRQRLALD